LIIIMSAQASSSTARSGRARRSTTRQNAITEEEGHDSRAPSAPEVPVPEPAPEVPVPEPAPEPTTADLLRAMLQQQAQFQQFMEHQAAPANTKIFKMTDPDRFCGGATELDGFLNHLKRNFASHESLFPRGDRDKVQYALGHLGT
jgi:hypothetical protein